MKFPPGYGYPSRDNWKTMGELNLFDRAVILTFQVLAVFVVVDAVGTVGFGIVKGVASWG